MTTYDLTPHNATYRALPTGVPGLAVRLGRALERWGRDAAQPVDPAAVRRELQRQEHQKLRMLTVTRLGRQHW